MIRSHKNIYYSSMLLSYVFVHPSNQGRQPKKFLAKMMTMMKAILAADWHLLWTTNTNNNNSRFVSGVLMALFTLAMMQENTVGW